MKSERKKAIEKEISNTRSGGYSNFLYVDLDVLNDLGIEQFKCVDGDNFICIVSPDAPFFGRQVFVHYNIGVDNTTYLCAKKMYDKPCPICEAAYKLMRKDQDDEQITELRPTMRYLFFVVDMSSKKTMKRGVQWYDAPRMVKDGICGVSKHKRTKEIIDVSDPDEAKNVCFVKSGSRLRTRYEGFELEDREYDFQDEWLDLPAFDDVLQKVDYDKVKADFLGFSPDEDESEKRESRRSRDEEPEDGVSRKRKTHDGDDEPRKRKARDEDEDGELDKRRRRRSRDEDDESDRDKGSKDDEQGDEEDLKERLKNRIRRKAEEE